MRFPGKVAVVLFLVVIAVGIWVPETWSADKIKIGFMAPYVGVYAKLGAGMEKGFHMYLDEVGWKAGGREIEFIKSDTEGKPSLGPAKVRELVEKEKVHIIAGVIHSGVAYAIRDYVNEKKMPLVITNAGAPGLTADKKSPYIFRVSFVNGQQDLAGGWYAYNKLGIKRIAILAADYSAGHDKAEGFKKYFVASGGKVVKEIYPPLGSQDFAPFLADLRNVSKDIDAMWMFFAGSGSIRLVNQYYEYGLKKTVPLFVIGDTVDDEFLPSMRKAALGAKSYLHYGISIDTPENKKFVSTYLKKYHEGPSLESEGGYVGARVLVEAINSIGGKVEDTEALLAAIRKVSFAAPRGPFKFDKNQNVVENVYIRQVEKVNGKLVNVVKDVVPNVDQNWSPPK